MDKHSFLGGPAKSKPSSHRHLRFMFYPTPYEYLTWRPLRQGVNRTVGQDQHNKLRILYNYRHATSLIETLPQGELAIPN